MTNELINGSIDRSRPAETGALRSSDAGWPVFGLPMQDKFPPEAGRTGWNGVDMVKPSEIMKMTKRANYGIRMPLDVVGLDVDDYVKNGTAKHGGTTLRALSDRYGELPESPRLTARDPDGVSGIRCFTVSPGTILQSIPGPGIEAIQRHHRYMVGPGSTHPELKQPYRWYGPDDVELDYIPLVADLPALPESWVEGLRVEAKDYSGGHASANRVEQWLRSDVAPCRRIKDALSEAEKQFEVGSGKHDAMLKAQWAILRLTAEGHRGGPVAAQELCDAFVQAKPGSYDEFVSAFHGGLGKSDRIETKVTGCCMSQKTQVLRVDLTEKSTPQTIDFALHHLETMPDVFLRGDALVTVPRIGAADYAVPDKHEESLNRPGLKSSNGPAQIRTIRRGVSLQNAARRAWYVFRTDDDGNEIETLLPGAEHVLDDAELSSARPLSGVYHTPVMLKDGQILTTPGYDAESQCLYLPESGLVIPEIPEGPTADEAEKALARIVELLAEFPWLSLEDLTNYLAALFTPVILPAIDDPGPLLLLNARMYGTGKTLLAKIFDSLFGAVIRPNMSMDETEIQKRLVAMCMSSTAPVFVMDNLIDVIKSGTLASYLTESTVRERELGFSRDVTLDTKRQWVATGNNLRVGGDMPRRVIWSTIDAGGPRPWERTDFAYEDLIGHIDENRGQILADMLIVVRAWVTAGSPVVNNRTDSMGPWFAIMNGILEVAGWKHKVGQTTEDKELGGEDDDNLEALLSLIYKEIGNERFRAVDLAKMSKARGNTSTDIGDVLPLEIHDLYRESGWKVDAIKRRLGSWLIEQLGRYTGGGYVIHADTSKKGRANEFWVEKHDGTAEPSKGWKGGPGGGIATTPDSIGPTFRSFLLKTEKESTKEGGVPPSAGRETSTRSTLPPSVVLSLYRPKHPRNARSAEDIAREYSLEGDRLLDALVSDLGDYAPIQLATNRITHQMNAAGLRVDLDAVRSALDAADAARAPLYVRSEEMGLPGTGQPWRTGIAQQLIQEIKPLDFEWPLTEGGQFITKAESLRKFRGLEGPIADFVELRLAFHDVKSAFAAQVIKHQQDGRVFPKFDDDTANGRWKTHEPNILGAGKRSETLLAERKLIRAEEGMLLLGADLSAIDNRAIAGLSGDTAYLNAINSPLGFHKSVCVALGRDPDDDAVMQQVKALNHGSNYGLGARKLSDNLGITEAEAEALLIAGAEKYPDVEAWKEDVRIDAGNGLLLDNGFGRLATTELGEEYTQAPARVAASCAKDLLVKSLMNDSGLIDYLLFTVHDEVVLQIEPDQVEEMQARLLAAMCWDWDSPSGLVIPIRAELNAGVGPRWFDLYKEKVKRS